MIENYCACTLHVLFLRKAFQVHLLRKLPLSNLNHTAMLQVLCNFKSVGIISMLAIRDSFDLKSCRVPMGGHVFGSETIIPH